jgi:hypothetical protein
LSRNLKVKIYKTLILPVVLYGCETWSLSLREEHRLMVFENRVLRRIFGPKWMNNRPMEKICTLHQTSFGSSNQGELDGQGLWHAWGWGETCTGFWLGSQMERDHFEDQGEGGIKIDLRETG